MEGELDLISSFQAGIGNVVAIKGSAVTEEHARLLRRYTERLVFALDSDLAGDAAARRGIEIAERSGFDMRVATMPSGKDPDEAAREDPVALKKAIKTAVPMYDYFLASAIKRHDVSSSFGKKKISEEMLPILAKIENPIVQGHYIRAVSSALSVSEETIQEGLVKLRHTKGFVKKEAVADLPGVPALTRIEKMELYLLALLFQGKTSQLYDEFTKRCAVSDIVYPPARKILELFGVYLASHPSYAIKDFADSLPAELVGIFDEAFMWDISGFVEDPERFSREWQKALYESQRLRIKTRIEAISKSLHDPLTQSEEQAQTLQEEMAQLSRTLSQLEKGA